MLKDAYHHVEVHSVPAGVDNEDWLERRVADARASFLHGLGFTSGRLLARKLRLKIRVDPPRSIALDSASEIGITLRLRGVGDTLRLTESVYRVDGAWRRLRKNVSEVWAEDSAGHRRMPPDLAHETSAWLGLERGTVPVADADTTQARTGA